MFGSFAEQGEVPGPAGNGPQWDSVSTLCRQALCRETALNSQLLNMPGAMELGRGVQGLGGVLTQSGWF